MRLLADPGPPFTTQPLAYDITHGGGDIRHIAFQKRDGSYLVAFWLEEPSFDPPAQRDSSLADRSATLTLPRPMRIQRAYRWQTDGTLADIPVRQLTASMGIDVSDHLTMLEIAEAEPSGPPGAPGLVAPLVSGQDVRLRWNAPAAGGTPSVYQLEVAADRAFSAILSMPIAAPGTELFVPGAPPGTYFVRVRAANAAGAGGASAEVPVMVPSPSAPQLVAERADANPVAMSWRPGPGTPPDYYVISAGTSPGTSDLAVMPIGLTTRVVTPLPHGVRIFVRVAAAGRHSVERSNEVSFALGSRAPPPAPLLASPSVSGAVVTLSWSAAGDATSYLLLARLSPGGPVLATLPLHGLQIVIPGVPPGTYYVSVVAQRDGVNGPESNLVRIDVH